MAISRRSFFRAAAGVFAFVPAARGLLREQGRQSQAVPLEGAAGERVRDRALADGRVRALRARLEADGFVARPAAAAVIDTGEGELTMLPFVGASDDDGAAIMHMRGSDGTVKTDAALVTINHTTNRLSAAPLQAGVGADASVQSQANYAACMVACLSALCSWCVGACPKIPPAVTLGCWLVCCSVYVPQCNRLC